MVVALGVFVSTVDLSTDRARFLALLLAAVQGVVFGFAGLGVTVAARLPTAGSVAGAALVTLAAVMVGAFTLSPLWLSPTRTASWPVRPLPAAEAGRLVEIGDVTAGTCIVSGSKWIETPCSNPHDLAVLRVVTDPDANFENAQVRAGIRDVVCDDLPPRPTGAMRRAQTWPDAHTAMCVDEYRSPEGKPVFVTGQPSLP